LGKMRFCRISFLFPASRPSLAPAQPWHNHGTSKTRDSGIPVGVLYQKISGSIPPACISVLIVMQIHLLPVCVGIMHGIARKGIVGSSMIP
jgi:hypothetical protein